MHIQYSLPSHVYKNKGMGRLLKSEGKESIRNAGISDAVRMERRRLLDFIRKRVGSDEDAEDILQDVFYQLTASYGQTIEHLSAWLFAVARNKIIDWYRKRKFGSSEGGGAAEEEGIVPLEEMLPDPGGGPDAAFVRALLWEELEEALEELPKAQRLAFVRHELDGMSFKEIAEETGDSINTLLSRKRYAVLFLRERLQELYDDFQQ
jgi:RNA polymerase sigma factor (sigma-70 family)